MEKKLYRDEQNKMIAGVCAGLADYFGIDVAWVRVAFIIAVLVGLSGILAYVILWIAVPPRLYNPNFYQHRADYTVRDNETFSENPANKPFQPIKKRGNGRLIAGLIFIILGSFFLLDEFDIIPYWFDFGKLWPLIFIIPGILLLASAGKINRFKKNLVDEQNLNTSATSAAAQETQNNTDQTVN
ncbi:MAG: PspC domain-containing protein [Daejeonella sp.]